MDFQWLLLLICTCNLHRYFCIITCDVLERALFTFNSGLLPYTLVTMPTLSDRKINSSHDCGFLFIILSRNVFDHGYSASLEMGYFEASLGSSISVWALSRFFGLKNYSFNWGYKQFFAKRRHLHITSVGSFFRFQYDSWKRENNQPTRNVNLGILRQWGLFRDQLGP